MKLLAFDTSTERMSIAVQRSDPDAPDQVWQHEATGGAQTSTHLIPVIEQLMTQAALQFTELDAIVFGRGPGSFTGLRTACSVAQGLAFAAQLKVLPVDTLLAVAEEARLAQAPELASWRVTALLDARMDELYGASYVFDQGRWSQTAVHALLRPEDLALDEFTALAGNVFAAYGARLPATRTQRIAAMPTATALLRLAPDLLAQGGAVRADQALPLYVRDKVAKTTLERALEKSVS